MLNITCRKDDILYKFYVDSDKYAWDYGNGDLGVCLCKDYEYFNIIDILCSNEFKEEKVLEEELGYYCTFDVICFDKEIHEQGYIGDLFAHNKLINILFENTKDLRLNIEREYQKAKCNIKKSFFIPCKNCGRPLGKFDKINEYTFRCASCNEDTVSGLLKHWQTDVEAYKNVERC